MPTEEEYKALRDIVILQTGLIEGLANALDEHNLDGPHYTEIHRLKDMTQVYIEKYGKKVEK